MSDQPSGGFGRVACFVYGLVVYVLFLGTFTYTIGFVGGLVVPKTIDSGTANGMSAADSMLVSILINVGLLSLFAIQHTIMARPVFKNWWTKIIPSPIERSTYVLATCVTLVLLFWQWRPLPETVWSVELPAARMALYGLFALGWVLVLYSTFCINHFDLFGMRQVVLHLGGKPYTHPEFATPWIYNIIRNPLMLGFLIAFWATPQMSQGHLLFSLVTMGYIFVGIWFEERDLLEALDDSYRLHRAKTPMIFPWPRPSVAPEPVD